MVANHPLILTGLLESTKRMTFVPFGISVWYWYYQMANFGTRILKYNEVVYKKVYPSRGSDDFQGAEMSEWNKMRYFAGDIAWLERVRRIYRHQNVTSGLPVSG